MNSVVPRIYCSGSPVILRLNIWETWADLFSVKRVSLFRYKDSRLQFKTWVKTNSASVTPHLPACRQAGLSILLTLIPLNINALKMMNN